MINEIKDKEEFKKLCQKAWDKNSDVWINNRILPIKLKKFIIDFLFEKENPFILDIGCGNGWLLQELNATKSAIKFNYVGVDINHNFIDFLKGKWFDFKYDFFVADFEEKLNVIRDDSVDKAIAVLSLIEMSDLEIAFKNITDKLKNGGCCMIVVLNPYIEMIRINSNMNELKNDIASFRNGNLFFYEKKIISKELESEVNYYGLLHPIEKYFSVAKKSGLLINDFREIDAIDELGTESTIYHCIEFVKP